jgi:hypothetical protein
MRLPLLLLGLCAHTLAALSTSESSPSSSVLTDHTTIYIEPIDPTDFSPTPATALAEIKYNPSTLDAKLLSFEAPEIPPNTRFVRIGTWDAAANTWKSATSMTSAETFARGFRPTLVVTLDANGGVLGVSCKSGAIDAGQTRDFAPRVLVRKGAAPKQPELNTPVVLSKEGKVEEPAPEKTMLQK